MTESKLRKLKQAVGLAKLAIVVGVAYHLYITPALVLQGKAEKLREYVAGCTGLLFWAFAAKTIAGV